MPSSSPATAPGRTGEAGGRQAIGSHPEQRAAGVWVPEVGDLTLHLEPLDLEDAGGVRVADGVVNVSTEVEVANRCTSTWNGTPPPVVPSPVTSRRVDGAGSAASARGQPALGDRERAGGAADHDHARAGGRRGGRSPARSPSSGAAVSPSDAPSSSPPPSEQPRDQRDAAATSEQPAAHAHARRRRLAALLLRDPDHPGLVLPAQDAALAPEVAAQAGPRRATYTTPRIQWNPTSTRTRRDHRARDEVVAERLPGLEVVELVVEPDLLAVRPLAHSHSIVPGGFDVTSSTTRLTSRTSLVMRVEIAASTS